MKVGRKSCTLNALVVVGIVVIVAGVAYLMDNRLQLKATEGKANRTHEVHIAPLINNCKLL